MPKLSRFVFLFIHFHFLSFAGAFCPRIDLRQEKFLPTQFLQEERDWCFAFAAAASVSSLVQKPISAEDLALHHNLREMQAHLASDETSQEILKVSLASIKATEVLGFAGGSISEAVNLLARKGYCLESDGGSSSNIHQILNLQFQSSSASDLLGFWNQKCVSRISARGILKLFPLLKSRDRQRALIKIQKALQQNLIPSLSVDGNLVLKALGQPTSEVRQPHAIAVVGQETNSQGQCVYFVRDSFSGKNISILASLVLLSSDQLFEPVRAQIHDKLLDQELDLPPF